MKLEKGDWVYNTYTKKPEQIQDIIGKQYMLDYNDLYDEDELEPLTNEHISTFLSGYKEHQKEDDFDVSRYTLHNKLLECCKIKDDYYKNLFIKYTQWLCKREIISPDLQFDIEHLVDTFFEKKEIFH